MLLSSLIIELNLIFRLSRLRETKAKAKHAKKRYNDGSEETPLLGILSFSNKSPPGERRLSIARLPVVIGQTRIQQGARTGETGLHVAQPHIAHWPQIPCQRVSTLWEGKNQRKLLRLLSSSPVTMKGIVRRFQGQSKKMSAFVVFNKTLGNVLLSTSDFDGSSDTSLIYVCWIWGCCLLVT